MKLGMRSISRHRNITVSLSFTTIGPTRGLPWACLERGAKEHAPPLVVYAVIGSGHWERKVENREHPLDGVAMTIERELMNGDAPQE
ncbi:hypothetical protein SCHPADRAFT_481669 [Schizopora paradoxa]|uniref:Uncharacterized protein n=1 Tax=Schizopora paradoxa TaxID=27342 RepID=A0A0H2RH85_9AGAM|nr:hypothetical protein SCHPADRAFT_481669 [Schizopora paradoxa]